jgi:hypothetical protein
MIGAWQQRSIVATPEGDVYNAITRRDLEALRSLLTQNEKLLESNPYGQPDDYSFLYIVASKGDIESARVFIESGASINREGPSPLFLTALCGAAEGGHLDMVRDLLARGALIDGTDLSAVSPLMLAAREGHLEVVRLLLSAGAEVNRLGCVQRFLPVDFSGWHRSEQVEQLLRERGGISVTDNFDWQSQRGYPVISHVSNDGGPVYPLGFLREVGDQPFSFRLAEIRAKTKPLFLFSAGLYEFGRSIELAFALHPHWPIRQRYLSEKSLASFPLDFLQRVSTMIASGQAVEPGALFLKNDAAFSDLSWPSEVSALIAVDHRWTSDKSSDFAQRVQRDVDEVTILTLIPVLSTEKQVEDVESANRWATKKQTATWAKITLPLTYSHLV